MNKKEGYISLGNKSLHYIEWGVGRQLLLAFHGYGNDARVFKPFETYLQNNYTILSFDLPHHGGSEWEDGALLMKNDLLDLVKKVMTDYATDKISLLGYSMGGRVCLTIIEYMPECIGRAVLMASDGLTPDFYYSFYMKTYLGRKIFRNMLHKPTRYLQALDWLKQKKLMDESRHKFAMKYIKTNESRDFLSKAWPVMSDIIPNLGKLKKAIRKYQIPIYLFMGANDKIMSPSRAERFKKGLDTVQLFVLGKGHRVFDEDNAGDIAKVLLGV